MTGTIGDGFMAQRQGSGRTDRDRWTRITLAGQDVENHIDGMDAVADGLGTGRQFFSCEIWPGIRRGSSGAFVRAMSGASPASSRRHM